MSNNLGYLPGILQDTTCISGRPSSEPRDSLAVKLQTGLIRSQHGCHSEWLSFFPPCLALEPPGCTPGRCLCPPFRIRPETQVDCHTKNDHYRLANGSSTALPVASKHRIHWLAESSNDKNFSKQSHFVWSQANPTLPRLRGAPTLLSRLRHRPSFAPR